MNLLTDQSAGKECILQRFMIVLYFMIRRGAMKVSTSKKLYIMRAAGRGEACVADIGFAGLTVISGLLWRTNFPFLKTVPQPLPCLFLRFQLKLLNIRHAHPIESIIACSLKKGDWPLTIIVHSWSPKVDIRLDRNCRNFCSFFA